MHLLVLQLFFYQVFVRNAEVMHAWLPLLELVCFQFWRVLNWDMWIAWLIFVRVILKIKFNDQSTTWKTIKTKSRAWFYWVCTNIFVVMDYNCKSLSKIVPTLKVFALLTYKQNLKSQINLKAIHNVLFLSKSDKARRIKCTISESQSKSTVLIARV